ncbi:MAG: CPBP family intramembrane glutamic endopeptidase [Deltaproteobacteria bacterium]
MRRFPLLSYFVLASLLSWLAWAPLAAVGLGWSTIHASPYLHLAGGFGPMIAALVVTTWCDGRPGLIRLAVRCTDARGRLASLAIAVAAPLCLFAVSALALNVSGLGEVAWADVGRSVEYPALNRPVFWLANILCYGFGEEVGWRGFALPRIQARRTALTSAILVSGAWAAWHLPLFAFTAGMSSMGMAGVAGWLFSLVTGSILLTWLFNRSNGSVLAVALFHGVLDIVMTSPVKGALPSVMGTIIMLWGLAIPFTLGRANLSRLPRVRDLADRAPPHIDPR